MQTLAIILLSLVCLALFGGLMALAWLYDRARQQSDQAQTNLIVAYNAEMSRMSERHSKQLASVMADMRDGQTEGIRAVSEAIDQTAKAMLGKSGSNGMDASEIAEVIRGHLADSGGIQTNQEEYFSDFEGQVPTVGRELAGGLAPGEDIPGIVIGHSASLEHNMSGENFK